MHSCGALILHSWQDYITRLSHKIMSWNCVTRSCHKIKPSGTNEHSKQIQNLQSELFYIKKHLNLIIFVCLKYSWVQFSRMIIYLSGTGTDSEAASDSPTIGGTPKSLSPSRSLSPAPKSPPPSATSKTPRGGWRGKRGRGRGRWRGRRSDSFDGPPKLKPSKLEQFLDY